MARVVRPGVIQPSNLTSGGGFSSIFKNFPQQRVYGQLNVRGNWLRGGCSEWENFRSGDIALQAIQSQITRLRYFTIITSNNGQDNVISFIIGEYSCQIDKQSAGNSYISLSRLKQIVNALMGRAVPKQGAVNIVCPKGSNLIKGSQTWSIMAIPYNNRNPLHPPSYSAALCLNCYVNSTDDCGTMTNYPLSPCKAPCRSQGDNGLLTFPYSGGFGHILSLEFSDIPRPSIVRLSVDPSTIKQTTVALDITTNTDGTVRCIYNPTLNRDGSYTPPSSLNSFFPSTDTSTSVYVNPSSTGIEAAYPIYKSVKVQTVMRTARVNLPFLIPATNYTVYCIVGSKSNGAWSTLSNAVSKKATFSTKCCKSIKVQLLKPFLPLNNTVTLANLPNIYPDAVKVSVDYEPTASVRINIKVFYYPETVVQSPFQAPISWTLVDAIYPNSLSISSNYALLNANSAPQVYPLSFSHTIYDSTKIAGFYSINVTISDVSANEYVLIQPPSHQRIKIADVEELMLSMVSLPKPGLASAEFSSDWSSILVIFDAPTDMGGDSLKSLYGNYFPCNVILSFIGNKASQCKWQSMSSLIIYPSTNYLNPNVTVPQTMRLYADRISHDCTYLDNYRYGPVTIFDDDVRTKETIYYSTCTSIFDFRNVSNRPKAVYGKPINITASTTSKPAPIITLTAPEIIGGCDQLTLDISQSTGSLGKPWRNITFAVLSNRTLAAADSDMLSAFLNNDNFTLVPPTPIPSWYFVGGRSYTIIVSACNFYDSCARDEKAIYVTYNSRPVVYMQGAPRLYMKQSDGISITANASYVVCSTGLPQNVAKSFLDYQWQIYPDGSTVPLNITSTSKDPSIFSLPPYTLSANTVYNVLVNVTDVADNTWSTAYTKLYVSHGLLIASFAGGSQRTIRVGGTLSLDPSGSYDEDVPPSMRSAARASLYFTITCIQTEPYISIQGTCGLTGVSFGTYSGRAPPSAFTFTAPDDLMIGSINNVTLTVWDKSGRVATTTVTIITVPGDSCQIAISPPSARKVVNYDQVLAIGGIVTPSTSGSSSAITATWSIDDSRVSLAKNTLGPYIKTIPVTATTRPSTVNLIISPNSLLLQSQYTFTLTCATQDGSSTPVSESVVISINQGPQPGSYTLIPTSGTALTTTFTLCASNWQTSYLPLSYEFGFIVGKKMVSRMTLQSRSEANTAITVLPYVSQSKGLIPIYVRVFDNLEASAIVSKQALITKLNTTSLTDLVSNLLNNVDRGDVDTSRKAISLASTILNNNVDCSKAPSCAALNRYECQATPNTCGECLRSVSTTYYGESGNKNTPCYSNSYLDSVLANYSSAQQFLNASQPSVEVFSKWTASITCFNSTDCGGGTLMTCDKKTQSCQFISKSCINSCSKQGVCVFKSLSTGATLNTCSFLDASCGAFCQCYYGRYGSACERSVFDSAAMQVLQDKRMARNLLMSALSDVSLRSDLTAETARFLTANIAALTQQPTELYLNATKNIATVASAIVAAASTSFVPYSEIEPILDSVNTMTLLNKAKVNTNTSSIDTMRRNLVENRNSISLNMEEDQIEHEAFIQAMQLERNDENLNFPRALQSDLSQSPSLTSDVDQVSSIKATIAILTTFMNVVSAQIVGGQAPISYIKSLFRLTVSSQSTNSLISDSPPSITVSTPQTVGETLSSGVHPPFSIAVQGVSSSDESGIYYPISQENPSFAIGALEMSSDAYPAPATNSIYSNALILSLSSLPCPYSAVAGTGLCTFNVTMPNKQPVFLDRKNYGNSPNETFQVYCHENEVSSSKFTCPNGDVVYTNCTGIEGGFYIDCYHSYSFSTCSQLSATIVDARFPTTCKPLSMSALQTVCTCTIPFSVSSLSLISTTPSSPFASSTLLHQSISSRALQTTFPIPDSSFDYAVLNIPLSSQLINAVRTDIYPLQKIFSPFVNNWAYRSNWSIPYCFGGTGGVLILLSLMAWMYDRMENDKKKDEIEKQQQGWNNDSKKKKKKKKQKRKKWQAKLASIITRSSICLTDCLHCLVTECNCLPRRQREWLANVYTDIADTVRMIRRGRNRKSENMNKGRGSAMDSAILSLLDESVPAVFREIETIPLISKEICNHHR